MNDPGWYKPVPRGVESKIAEKMAFLKSLDDEAKKK
jgi:putative ATPase